MGWVAGSLFPALEGRVLYSFLGDNVFLGSVLVGILGTIVLTFVNYRGAGMAATFQDLLVLGLLIVSAVFMAVGFMRGDTENLRPLFVEGTSTSWWGGVLAVFATAPFWYSGFDTIPQAMGEKSEGAPLHLVSRVVVLAIVVAAIFYARPSSLLITLGAVGSLVMLVLSFLQPYWDESQRWPLEWTFLLVWGFLGVLFWFMAARIRNGISESERRILMME